MPRHHHTEHGEIPFTPEEEAAWDAQEAAVALPSALDAFRLRRDLCLAKGVAHAGHIWQTDGPSQWAMSAAVVLGEAAENATGQPWSTIWKTRSGFISVTLAQLTAAGLAVGGYVQAAFTREAALTATAAGGDIAAALAAINTGWPG